MSAPVEPKKFAFSQNILPAIQDMAKEMVEVRHQIHAHPELAFEEHATSDMVAARLKEWGYEVHRGLAGTGVVGTLKRGTGKMRLGIRADMDALPIQETTGLPYASQLPGKMHACGHDGHTAILLAAARSIAQDPQFDGTLNLIFQPAEEGLGGGRVMVEQGLFKLFPCDAIFALHNMPGMPEGQFGFRAGAFMPSSDTVNITVRGKGGHGSAPHLSADPVVAAAHIVVALQTVVSRNVDPREMAVISVGAIHGGEAANVIPQNVTMRLTVRAFNPEIRAMLKQRITDLVQSQAQTMGVQADVDYDWRYPSLINDEASTAFAKQVALDWLGDKGVMPNLAPLTGSEDFSFMLQECPGCYLIVGNGQGEHHHTGGCMVHNPGYDFNDAILPIAASYWVKLVNAYLKAA
ncbi:MULTISPECIES: M20 aminoacylase family protein [unclassified Limnohabitans]|jgi:hippurate hydrolase|uniref:M20 aminoacylase family protein n=1 Tax=unclassified Limnohabitans TaxID=2626134 RepID=UPI0006DD26DF|nr:MULTISPECIES: M20 aminoacylase family protein [unclassified Limnohabitans]ALK91425.1 putative hydrolase YxeP [Limnohabitans sp. 103DPR2]PUE37955.1 amidohydrolase [Limnohabitans sp. Hippo4]